MATFATFSSRCGLCDEQIEEGDRIRLEDDEWVHEHCSGEEEDYSEFGEDKDDDHLFF